mgnify:CR=1 FL=1
MSVKKYCHYAILKCRPSIRIKQKYTAKYARLHNNANILAIGADDVTTSEAVLILRMWLATNFEGGRHQERLNLIEELENKNMR